MPWDLLERVSGGVARDLPGLASEDYGLSPGTRFTERAAQSWERCKTYWASLRAQIEAAGEGAPDVGITRQAWLIPLLRELGYDDLEFQGGAEDIDGQEYRISHRAGIKGNGPPVHLVGMSQELDRLGSDGGQRVSPHGHLQSYLNATGHVWGLVANGRRLRLLRDNVSLTRPAYVEFDLEGMMEGGVFSDFVLLWLLTHRTRLPGPSVPPDACYLEQWHQTGLQQGARAYSSLRLGVERAIRELGQGFIEHPQNDALRARAQRGELDAQGYYTQLLRVVYRVLFLLVAEERDLLFPAETSARGRVIYDEAYSVSRLRDRRLRSGDERHLDLWRTQRTAFDLLRGGNEGLGLSAIGGGVFDPAVCADLEHAELSNRRLIDAIRGLSLARTDEGVLRRISYRDLDVEELGSVYESLLDEEPELRATGGMPRFELAAAGERKTTGAYYTPSEMVDELVDSTLEPVIESVLAEQRSDDAQIDALLALSVCDPACGSGHFLLAAARRIGREVARLESGGDEPSPESTRHAVRRAIASCVYGVDANPLAVELCRLALWIEGHEPGRPLGFLDHHIKCGNSLIGATATLIEEGIPSKAFDRPTGPARENGRAVAKRNAAERRGQLPLAAGAPLNPNPSDDEIKQARAIAAIDELIPADVKQKKDAFEQFEAALATKRALADAWTAAFFWPLESGWPDPITEGRFEQLRGGQPPDAGTKHLVESLAAEYRFFHWELEFPGVLGSEAGGFDCVIGNPPWERVKLEEKEFFAGRDEAIVAARTTALRKRAIEALRESNPSLIADFDDAGRRAERTSGFLRTSGRFPLGSSGDVNYYPVFVELMSTLISSEGQAGVVCPTGIATDDGTKALFAWLSDGRLKSLFDFENRRNIFPDVHSRMKFCLLTIRGRPSRDESADFAFYCTSIDELRDDRRHFTLTAHDFDLFNPNTRNCPIFRTARDAEIARKLYGRAGVFWRAGGHGREELNPWSVKLSSMFHMSNDSELFRIRSELETQRFTLRGNRFEHPDDNPYLPLYEAKLFRNYDHRFATFEGQSDDKMRRGSARDLTSEEKSEQTTLALPRYWVPTSEVGTRLADGGDAGSSWFLALRSITRPVDVRTVIGTILSASGLGNSAIRLAVPSAAEAALLLACLNSMVLDWAARLAMGGVNLNFFVLKQLPVLPPALFHADGPSGRPYAQMIIPRVEELVCTADDLVPFSIDLGNTGAAFDWDARRRHQLQSELDAILAKMYGLNREELDWILDANEPSVSFPILKANEEREFGEYRTKRYVLAAFDQLQAGEEPDLAAIAD